MKRHDNKIGKYAGIHCHCCAVFGIKNTHKSKSIISRRARRKEKIAIKDVDMDKSRDYYHKDVDMNEPRDYYHKDEPLDYYHKDIDMDE